MSTLDLVNSLLTHPHYKVDKSNNLFYLNKMIAKGVTEDILAQNVVYIKKRERVLANKERLCLVIEPHPDDFALSVYDIVSELFADHNVTVLSCFSRATIDSFTWNSSINIVEERYEEVRIEESKFCIEDVLGYKFESLRLPLARNRGYLSIFDVADMNDKSISVIRKRIIELCEPYPKVTIMLPMAVNNHVDHTICKLAGLRAIKQLRATGVDVQGIVYEDYPYARNKFAYFKSLSSISKSIDLKTCYINMTKNIRLVAEVIMCYRSQFDDMNLSQILAVKREDYRNIASEYGSTKNEYMLRYHEIGDD